MTGAAGGIGAATVKRLARAGYRVVATDRDGSALARLQVALLAEQLSVETEVMDVTSQRDVVRVARRVHEAGGDLDLLVNNAGYAELGPIDLVDMDALRRQLDVNVLGAMRTVRAFAPQMCDRGAGRIVQVSSLAGLVAFPFMGVYHASKFALEALSDALRQELGSFGVDVILVEPAFIRTGFAQTARQTTDAYRGSPAARQWQPAFDRMERAHRPARRGRRGGGRRGDGDLHGGERRRARGQVRHPPGRPSWPRARSRGCPSSSATG